MSRWSTFVSTPFRQAHRPPHPLPYPPIYKAKIVLLDIDNCVVVQIDDPTSWSSEIPWPSPSSPDRPMVNIDRAPPQRRWPPPPLLPEVMHRGDCISPSARYQAYDRRHHRPDRHFSLTDRTGEEPLERPIETASLRSLPDRRSGMKSAYENRRRSKAIRCSP